jgi:FKBP-type peptidyl-prolyl cis-trans isomerase
MAKTGRKQDKTTTLVVIIAVVALAIMGAALFVSSRQNEVTGAAGAGQAFLEENAQMEDVQTTASGLQYKVLTEADGEKPTASSTVTVHYRGTLTDGTEFDSSYSRGQPATFPLNGVIPGWTEGLQLMSVGSKYQFFIPPELGYGARGIPGVIPANAVLVFEVELLDIQ